MFNKPSVTIDITDSNVRVVSFEGEKIIKWASKSIPEGLVKGGVIMDPKATAVVLDEILNSLQLNRNRVICTLTGLPFIYRTITMPNVKKGIKAETIEREGRRELSVSEQEMFLFWQTAEVKLKENEMDYFVLAVPKAHLNSLMQTLSLARISSPVIDIKSLALSRAVALREAIIISLEKHYFEYVMVANGFVRVIHSISSEAKSEDNMGIVSDVIDGLSKAVKFFNGDYSQSSLPLETPIVLTGELSSNPEILRLVRNATGHPTDIYKSQPGISQEMPTEIYASNIGLMLKNKPVFPTNHEYTDISISLVPQMKKPKAFQISWSYAFLIAVAVLMALLVYKSYDLKTSAAGNAVIMKQSSDQVVEQITTSQNIAKEALSSKQGKADQYSKISTQLTQIRNSSQMIAQQKRDYISLVDSLIQVLPEGAEYSMIEINRPEIKFDGKADSPNDVLNMAEDLENNPMYSSVRIASINPSNGLDKTVYQFQIVLGMNSIP